MAKGQSFAVIFSLPKSGRGRPARRLFMDSCGWNRDARLGPELPVACALAGQEHGAPERVGHGGGGV